MVGAGLCPLQSFPAFMAALLLSCRSYNQSSAVAMRGENTAWLAVG